MSTGGTTLRTIENLILKNGEIFRRIGVLVNRSGVKHLEGREIVSLIDREMPMWEPEDCPLCKEGSKALRPKITEHWERLVAGK